MAEEWLKSLSPAHVEQQLRARIAQLEAGNGLSVEQAKEMAELRSENQRLRTELECPAAICGVTSKVACIASGQCGCNVAACSMREEMQRLRTENEALRADKESLDWLDNECADLRCVSDNYEDDSYEVVTHHMDKAQQRVVGTGKDVRAAIRDARNPKRKRKIQADLDALCEDCPPDGYPTDSTRCSECPMGSAIDAARGVTADEAGGK